MNVVYFITGVYTNFTDVVGGAEVYDYICIRKRISASCVIMIIFMIMLIVCFINNLNCVRVYLG